MPDDLLSSAPIRIGPLAPEEWTDEARDVFAYWEGPAAREGGSKSNTMMALANHPRLALAQLDFGKYILLHSTLTPKEKELVVLRVAWRFGSHYQWAHHVHAGRLMGMTDAEFAALEREGPQALWSEAEQAFIDGIDQLCAAGRIDDATWTRLVTGMDRHRLMDFLYSVGFFTMNAWAFGAMGIELEPGFEEFSTPPAERAKQAGDNS
jgi:alkylhydroperoxidase family enzyme